MKTFIPAVQIDFFRWRNENEDIVSFRNKSLVAATIVAV